MSTPVTVMQESTLERRYNFPPLCKGKHRFEYSRVSYAFDNNSESIPYPMFGYSCILCGELDRK